MLKWLFAISGLLVLGAGCLKPTPVKTTIEGIDVHMHLGVVSARESDLATAYASAGSELIERMDALNVERAIIVAVPNPNGRPADSAVEENIALVTERYPDRLSRLAGGAVLNTFIQATAADAVTAEVKSQFRTQAQAVLDRGGVGFGEMLALHLCLGSTHSYQYASPDHPLFLELADIAAERGVPIDLHNEAVLSERTMPENLKRACSQNPDTLPATIPALERLLEHNPKAQIVWQHIGWDNTGEQKPALITRLLQDHPNLFIAIRVEERLNQVGTSALMPNRLVDENGQIQSDWLKLFKTFPDRFVIGSDEFIDSQGKLPIGAASLDQTWNIINQLPADLATAIAHDNAARIYHLE